MAVTDGDGQPIAVVGVGKDVTALRTLQEQVIHSEKLATLGQLAAGVAHEINNPLTSIDVSTEALCVGSKPFGLGVLLWTATPKK